LIGQESIIRRSEGDRYTKIHLPICGAKPGYPKRAAWLFPGRAAQCSAAKTRLAMNQSQDLRILVDRAIDNISVPHGRACSCSFCMTRHRNPPLSPAFFSPRSSRFRDSDPFLVRRVVPIGPLPQSHIAPRPLLVGVPMAVRGKTAQRELRRQLWSPAGVFLSGATQQQALRWAQRQAARVRGTVTGAMSGRSRTSLVSERHRDGRPHFHIELRSTYPGQPLRRSGHSFWGRLPTSGVFFEADDN
jgi:hypothetical protein